MDIRVHLARGKAHAFRIESKEESERIIAAIQPAKLFRQPALQLRGSHTTVTINPPSIECIEFKTVIEPPPSTMRSFEPIEPGESPESSFEPPQLVSANEYERLARELVERRREERNNKNRKKAGMEIDSAVELCFRSGAVRHIHVKGTLGPGEDRRKYSLKVFDTPCMVARWAGGFALINPKNVNTFTLTPGISEKSPLTWRAEPLREG